MMAGVQKCKGFTLIEMVTVIVLLGIIAGILTPFISSAMQAYVASKARANLVAKGRLAMERIIREVRLAVPNSLSVVDGGNGIEFARSRAGGRYVEQFDDFGSEFSRNNYRFRTNANRQQLYVVGNNASTQLAFNPGDELVIANFSPAILQAGTSRVALSAINDTTVVDDDTANGQILTYVGGPPGHKFVTASPGKHFSIADRTIEIGRLASDATWRWHSVSGFADYDIDVDWSNSDPVLADGVNAGTSFSYSSGTPQAPAVLRIDLQLDDTNSSESIQLYQEVVLRNTP